MTFRSLFLVLSIACLQTITTQNASASWPGRADAAHAYAVSGRDTAPSAYTAGISMAVAAPAAAVDSQLMAELAKRNNVYGNDIVVYEDSILVSFYDNGDIDDDSISVFLNKRPILSRRGLSGRALNIYIGLDPSVEVHELTMFAENLGEFPPNTALMVISDSNKRYEVYLSASLKQNASIRLRRPRK